MSTADDTAPGTHPVSQFVERLNSRLDDLATTPLLSMSAQDRRNGLAAIAAIATAEAELAALRLRLMADAGTSGACTETGAASLADWVAVQTRHTRRAARSDLRLALCLERSPVLGEAMAAGHVSTAQARVIDPDLVDTFEGRRLEAEEAQAARKTTFTMAEDSQGIADGRFRVRPGTPRCCARRSRH